MKNNACYFFVPEQAEEEKMTKELTAFNNLAAVINLVVWSCNKLTSIQKKIKKDDILAKNIFDNYKQSCEKNIMGTEISFVDSLYSIEIQDNTIKIMIINSIEALKTFISSISSCRTWYINADGLRNALGQINNNRMHIQMQLASCDDLK